MPGILFPWSTRVRSSVIDSLTISSLRLPLLFGSDRLWWYHDDQSPLVGTHLLPRPADLSHRVADKCSSSSFDVSLTYSSTSSNYDHHVRRDAGAKGTTSNSNSNSHSNSSSNSTGNNPSPVQHVSGVDPWCLGNKGQAGCGGNDGEEKGECGSTETSYVEGFTQMLDGIFVDIDSCPGMNTVIGKRTDTGAEEVMTVGSTVALVSEAQAAVQEQMASMQRQVGEVDITSVLFECHLYLVQV